MQVQMQIQLNLKYTNIYLVLPTKYTEEITFPQRKMFNIRVNKKLSRILKVFYCLPYAKVNRYMGVYPLRKSSITLGIFSVDSSQK